MQSETQQTEIIWINKAELADVLVEIIQNDRELKKAIREIVWSCPNIITRI